MRYPEFLKDGGTIGFVAPSFGCATQPYKAAFEHALKQLEQKGFQTQLGPNCFAAEGIGISNTPQKCAEELNLMYESAENDILISCGGGELMCEILEYLDFERIKKADPKWYLGYSDNTNFTFLQTTICDTAAIYGPCAAAFGMEPWHPAITDTFELLQGKKLIETGYQLWEKELLKSEENPTEPYHVTEPRVLKCYDHNGELTTDTVTFEGRLIGGCLDCLGVLVGTKFDKVKEFNDKYQKDGFIWFLESCDLNVMSIRRTIWQLDQAGWFQHLKGFMIGRPLVHGQELMGLDQYEAVLGILRKYHVPVIMDVDLGHLPPAMPLINGVIAKVKTGDNEIKVDMKLR